MSAQAKEIARHQLKLWGLDYFDLYLMHFPVSLEYVKPEDKYPPEWWGLDGKVHPSECLVLARSRIYLHFAQPMCLSPRLGARSRNSPTRASPKTSVSGIYSEIAHCEPV